MRGSGGTGDGTVGARRWRARVAPPLLVVAASIAAVSLPDSSAAAQTLADARESAWNLGPVVSVGEAYPDYLADDVCGSDRSLALGGALDWIPSEAARWFGLEAEALFVTSWSDGLCVAPTFPPDSVMDVDTDLSRVFVALNGRAVAEIPVDLGRLRLHGGGGLLLSGARPAVTWGGGWVARSGDFTVSIILDWWTIWPGGQRVIEERTTQGFLRTPVGPFDESFDLRFLRLSAGWDVGGAWDG